VGKAWCAILYRIQSCTDCETNLGEYKAGLMDSIDTTRMLKHREQYGISTPIEKDLVQGPQHPNRLTPKPSNSILTEWYHPIQSIRRLQEKKLVCSACLLHSLSLMLLMLLPNSRHHSFFAASRTLIASLFACSCRCGIFFEGCARYVSSKVFNVFTL
jgi:hypothetical protein